MAESKYDLLLINTKPDKKIRPQAWYKERIIKTKYVKSRNPRDTSKILVGRNWSFVKDGLDDFRDGRPPSISNGIVIMGSKGPSPNIQGDSETSSVKEPAERRRFNKYDICYSRVTPQMLRKRENIEEIEYGLTQHPLALYPHLEESMPPDLFEEVVEILDPEMNWGDGGDDISSEQSESNFQTKESVTRAETEPQSDEDGDDPFTSSNPYRWLPRKEDDKDKKDKKKTADKRTSSPSQDEHIKKVTKDFCDWVAGLGGESNNIEASTIHSLFASGYETKPALSVPIHVVELTNVPPELRKTAGTGPGPGAGIGAGAAATLAQTQQKDTDKSLSSGLKQEKSDSIDSSGYVPSWSKVKYGAWYLSPESWKPRQANEPLQDPQQLKDQEMSDAKKKSNDLDEKLAPMHCAKSFMEYVDSKNNRRPEFLNRVDDFQKKAAEEERVKLEAEAVKSRRKLVSPSQRGESVVPPTR